MKLKGYILTWHYLDNYGSNLQAYAMQELLKSKNIDIKFLNYRKRAKCGIIYDGLRFIKYNIPTKNEKELRKKYFYKFRKKYLHETKMLNEKTLRSYKLQVDFIVCGSDQIWSSKTFDKEYFLDFCCNDNVKKFSYAASTIEDNYNSEQVKILKKCLDEFNKISTRETIGIEILKKYTSKKIEEVLDPTLVIPKSKWNLLAKDKCKYKNYVVCYFIGEDDKYKEITEEIKNKYNCEKIININIKDIHNFGDIIMKSASPVCFLNLIKNAEVVVSDSYHAILFALIFQKEFIAIKRFEETDKDNQNERITNILQKVCCLNRYINYKESINGISKMNYTIINQKLERYIIKSRNYINKMIEEVKSDNN